MTLQEHHEIARLQAEYVRRDASGRTAQLYRYTNPAFQFHMQEREWAILRLLRHERVDLQSTDVLEVGCGTGHILQRFLEFGAAKAVGVDLMESRVQEGRQRYPTLELQQGNAASLPYPEESFDLVTQFMCVSSVLDETLRRRMAQEMWRVLRPGGVVLWYDLRPSPPVIRLARRGLQVIEQWKHGVSSGDERRRDYPTPVKPISLQELRSLFHHGRLRSQTASLDLGLARWAGRSRGCASLLSCCSWLRTHYVAVIHKPTAAQPTRGT